MLTNLLSVIPALALGAGLSDQARSALASPSAFEAAVMSRWEYQCPSGGPIVQARMRGLVLAANYLGTKSLAALNPELASRVVAGASGRRLAVTCEDDGSGTPGALVSNRTVSGPLSLFLDDMMRMGPVVRLVGRRDFRDGQERQFVLQTFFHEFLHFAGIANSADEKHNNIPQGIRGYFQNDLVYACAAHAFPEAVAVVDGSRKYTQLGVEYVSETVERHLLYTRTACMTCASTEVGLEEASAKEKAEHRNQAARNCAGAQDVYFESEKPRAYAHIGLMIEEARRTGGKPVWDGKTLQRR